ncbi:hypothetical protein [Halorubrum sp. AJ67]|uniref:hypothetical protein n=1 Tax=Halorubrum sp. AJ67 TaxID=1173487 RepID=UPI001E5626B2|nr:hypothetical protein [Halorubrum sp. AJ67]
MDCVILSESYLSRQLSRLPLLGCKSIYTIFGTSILDLLTRCSRSASGHAYNDK